MDIWIAVDEANAKKAVSVLREFGMPEKEVTNEQLEDIRIWRFEAPSIGAALSGGRWSFHSASNKVKILLMNVFFELDL